MTEDNEGEEGKARELFAAMRVQRRLASRSRVGESALVFIQDQLDPTKWPDDLRDILIAIANALAGQALSPTLLRECAGKFAHALPDHSISITHEARGVIHPRRAFYRIAVVGRRLDGVWSYTPGQLSAALKVAASWDAVHKS